MGEQQAEEVSTARRAELAQRLTAVRRRIADACAAAGRGADEVALMAVTKTVAAADVAALLDLGLDLLGENRVQEATRKVEAVAASGRTRGPGGTSSADCSGTRHGPWRAGPNRWNLWTPCVWPTRSTPPSGAQWTPAGASHHSPYSFSTVWTVIPPAVACPVRTCSPWPSTSRGAPGCGWRG